MTLYVIYKLSIALHCAFQCLDRCWTTC